MRKAFLILAIGLIIFCFVGCLNITKPEKVLLDNILVDGKPVPGFQPVSFNYTYILPNGHEGIPEVIAVTRNETDVVRISKPDELPGTVVITVTPKISEGSAYETTIYTIFFTF